MNVYQIISKISILIIIFFSLFFFLNKFGFKLEFINSKIVAILLLLSSIILFKEHFVEKYIYVSPNEKPKIIGWENPLAQKII